MLKLQAENDHLKLENTRLKSDMAVMEHEMKRLTSRIGLIQKSRETTEMQASEVLSENKELKLKLESLNRRFQDSPILDENPVHVHFEDTISVNSNMTGTSSYKPDQEPQWSTETGPDFDSKWSKHISIIKSHPDFIVLKNNSRYHTQCLDDFLFSRIVDGVATVNGVPLPTGVVMQPKSEFTVYAQTSHAREIYDKSCILHRFQTFGTGKIIEDRLLDAEGNEAANYLFCVFKAL
ncbi:LZ_Tnp_IS66 domain-containing protein [Caenorhabditis elegans]|nr:LZ_Tnp_IS66 domain-containing protein [Caenorhabditis elegans]CCD65037.1 LZ_Tnp_IS66 domain-containing protein [Caenorhabditis elegans]|eukprot:NP_001022075.1 Uncharacterized protein CELE_F10C1.9 [Caenorhabditis elegans]